MKNYTIVSLLFVTALFIIMHAPFNSEQPHLTHAEDFESSSMPLSSTHLAIRTENSVKSLIEKTASISSIDIDMDEAIQIESFKFEIINSLAFITNPSDYWDIVYAIESNQGKLLFRKRNKSKNCTWTTAPCGHHQLTVRALKDIGCNKLHCRKDRLNFSKSLKMSKQLLALNEKRLEKHGHKNLQDYQKYLIHQQGASGLNIILGASNGKKKLPKAIKKNMANNSPFTYKSLRTMGDKRAANKFMKHWQDKWLSHRVEIAKNDDIVSIPVFDESEIQLALGYLY
ncbi:MAG: hypothetical protein V3U71_02980 [Cocleimonas sp.]